MKDWKLVVKNIVLRAADYADDAVDFMSTMKSYKITNEDLKEIGFECMLEIILVRSAINNIYSAQSV